MSKNKIERNLDAAAVDSSVLVGSNWSSKKIFIHACFVDDLQSFYKQWIEQSKGRMQFFDIGYNGELEHQNWLPSKICCETGEELTKENIDVKIGYWTPFTWKPVRKDLKEKAMKYEAFECQKIDCSCNDCKYLDRENAYCKKLYKWVRINANMCHPKNQKCFVHRRT